MRNAVPIFLLAIVGMTAPAVNASIERSTKEQVKNLAQRCNQIEAQLGRSTHYIRKAESDGATTIEQGWFNGAGDLIRKLSKSACFKVGESTDTARVPKFMKMQRRQVSLT